MTVFVCGVGSGLSSAKNLIPLARLAAAPALTVIGEARTAAFGATSSSGRVPVKDRNPPDLAVYGRDDERRVLSAVIAVGGARRFRRFRSVAAPLPVKPRPLLLSSQFDLLGDAEGVIDLDAEIADRAFELRVPEEQLDGPQVGNCALD